MPESAGWKFSLLKRLAEDLSSAGTLPSPEATPPTSRFGPIDFIPKSSSIGAIYDVNGLAARVHCGGLLGNLDREPRARRCAPRDRQALPPGKVALGHLGPGARVTSGRRRVLAVGIRWQRSAGS